MRDVKKRRAILGSALAPNIAAQFQNLPPKKFVVLLDDDDTGQQKAPILAATLNFYGHQACVAHLNSHPHIQVHTESVQPVKPKKFSLWDAVPSNEREEIFKINADLKTSAQLFEYYFKLREDYFHGFWRGLPLDFLLNFNCRVVEDWKHPKNRVERKYQPSTTRLIIPSSTDRFAPYYLALDMQSENHSGSLLVEKRQKKYGIEDKHRCGIPSLFNPSALEFDLVFAVDEELDALSIEYAGFHAVATCGGNLQIVVDAVKKIRNTPKIISLSDSNLHEILIELGIPAVKSGSILNCNCLLRESGIDALKQALSAIADASAPLFAAIQLPDRFFVAPDDNPIDDKITAVENPPPPFKDPNEILQADPALLKSLLYEIYDEAKNFSPEVADVNNDFFHDTPTLNTVGTNRQESDELSIWQETNGKINPAVLSMLYEKAAWLDSLTLSPLFEHDSSIHKTLGFFRFYDFFAERAENFLAALRERKAAAKKKISRFKKLSAHAEQSIELRGDIAKKELEDATPSDDDFSFADFNLNKFDAAVNSFAVKAKREHKAWLKQDELDQLNAKAEALKNDEEKNPRHLKDDVPDSPFDLILPIGVYLDERGIRVVDFDKPVTKNGRPVIEAAQNIIVPTCIFRESVEPDAAPVNGDQYRIAVKNGNDWRKPIVVSAGELTDPNSVAALSKNGALISSKNFFAKAMVKIIALNESNGFLPVKKVYTQPGWHSENGNDVFIYPTGNDDYIVKNGNFDYKKIFTPRGNKDEWLKIFHKILWHDPKNPDAEKINITAAIAIGAAAGAPLIKKLGIRNPQLNLGFESGNGKTALGKFAVSYFGNPNDLVPTCNATQNYLEDLAVKLNDFPHAVDELQAAKKIVREHMDDFVYNFSGGETRGRARKDGSARPTFRFRGCRLYTGEQNVTNDTSGQGAIARIFEIQHHDLFSDDFAIFLHNFTRDNYGFFGEHLATEVIPQNEQRIAQLFSSFKSWFVDSSGFDMLSSHSTILAYSLTGLFFALRAAGFDERTAYKITYEAGSESSILCSDAPTKFMAKNINRALPDLLEYIGGHPKNFDREISSNGAPAFHGAEANETYGVALADGRIAIAPSVLKRILNELGYPNANAIINGFGEAGYFTGSKSKNKYKNYQSRLPVEYSSLIGKTAWYYILQPIAELEDIGC